MKNYTLAVFPGDGIGNEVTSPCVELMHIACERVGGIKFSTNTLEAGAQTYQQTGEALPESAVEQARAADAILLAAMGDPQIRYPDGTEITPQIELRFILGLYAGIRPVRSIPGVPVPLADRRTANIDFVLIRESIEGLFAPYAQGTLEDDRTATETLVITRDVSEKLFKATFRLWQKRQGQNRGSNKVTCIDKANVFGAFAFFRKIFLVTENMFGDILSDQAAALIGGMGYAPSADIGDDHAVFQPCHGSAPDIAGQGLANPTAMFLSGAMLLDWLGDKHQDENAVKASQLIEQAVFQAFAGGQLRTCELGGDSGLMDVTNAVTC